MSEKLSLTEQANKLLEEAEAAGVQQNFFFATTFKRYQVQMKTLAELEKAINENGSLVEKEYVKGRKNVYTNPAISEYNKTATAANGTVQTLIKILTALNPPDAKEAAGESLARFIAGGKPVELR